MSQPAEKRAETHTSGEPVEYTIKVPAEIARLQAERDRLVEVNEGLIALLREALPHVEGVANSLTIMTGPIVGPVDRLASEIQAVLAEKPTS